MDREFGELPVLETERLQLRRLTPADAKDIYAYASDQEVTRYLVWTPHKSIDDSLAFIEASMIGYEERRPAPWGMVLKAEQKLIGTCDYIHWRPEHGRAEIGYALSRQYWGRGLMTEAVRRIIAYGFEIKDVNRIQAMCDAPNIGSARVMVKAGMVYEGTLRDYMVQQGGFRDMKIHAILKKDWRP